MPAQTVQVAKPPSTTATTLTLATLLSESVAKYATNPALRWKEGDTWKDFDYAELGRRVDAFAAGLLDLGLDAGDRVALFSKNCPQWAIADWANVSYGFVTVPIYDTLTPEKAAYILRDSGSRVIIVQTKEQLEKIRTVRKQVPSLRHIIVIEEVFEKVLETGEVLFDRVAAKGQASLPKARPQLAKMRAAITTSTLASIVYTSGTTGEPKGAMLTHGNFASNVVTALEVIEFLPQYVALSFLPLSHVFERMAGHFTIIRAGATIAYAQSIEKVPDNLLEVRPHVMMSVPRLYEKLYARIQDKVRHDSFIKRFFFRKAVAVGKQKVHEQYDLKVENRRTTKLWKRYDRLVYSKIRARVGGRLVFFVSGGAPLSPEIHEFFTMAGMPILQGYGLTETSPVIAANTLTRGFRVGSAGRPLPLQEVKIAADGEILTKGPNVFRGYWQKTAETKEAFTPDGYFKTGDIGRLDEDGFLFITDRKKELIVMSNGKKVAPQPIENDLKTKPGIGMAVLLGNNRPYITAILSPDPEAVKKWAQENKAGTEDLAVLSQHPEVRAWLQQGVDAVNESLSQYEKIKRFEVAPREFSQDGGELTPTLKVKRRVIDERYADLVTKLYPDAAST